MEWIIVIGLLIAMWIIALVPVEKLSKKLQDKGILAQDYKKNNAPNKYTQLLWRRFYRVVYRTINLNFFF